MESLPGLGNMETGRLGQEWVEVATYQSGAPAFMASLEGVLVSHRGCLVMGGGVPESWTLVVFRAEDIGWDGETLTFAGADYRIGDTLDLGGGHMQLQSLKGLRVPARWTDAETAFVVAPCDP
jgi:hypothetical protein